MLNNPYKLFINLKPLKCVQWICQLKRNLCSRFILIQAVSIWKLFIPGWNQRATTFVVIFIKFKLNLYFIIFYNRNQTSYHRTFQNFCELLHPTSFIYYVLGYFSHMYLITIGKKLIKLYIENPYHMCPKVKKIKNKYMSWSSKTQIKLQYRYLNI